MVMLSEIKVWLQQHPKVRIYVCLFCYVVGLVCFALSSASHQLLGKWIWWKILVLTLSSFLVYRLYVWLKKAFADPPISQGFKVHTTFLFLVITTVYSFFVEKKVNEKPDPYSLVSCVAFSIMSLVLSSLTHFGFEVDLLYFFTTFLTIQLIKIKPWLAIFGGGFMYFLVCLRFNWYPKLRSGSPAHQNQQDMEMGRSHSQRSRVSDSQVHSSHGVHVRPENDAVPLLNSTVDSSRQVNDDPQENRQGNSNNSDIIAPFMDCIKELKMKDKSVIDTVLKAVRKVNANVDDEGQIPEEQWHLDQNLVVDSYTAKIINELQERANKMMEAGLEKKCWEEYSSWRRMFLDMILSGFSSPNLMMEDIDNEEKIQGWLKTLTVAVRILFPCEQRLCERVFENRYDADFAFMEVCKELATHLLSTCYALAIWSNCTPTTLEKLMQPVEFVFLFTLGQSSIGKEASMVRKILGYFDELDNLIHRDEAKTTTDGGVHSITREVMDYIRNDIIKKGSSSLGRCFEEYTMAAQQRKLQPSAHLSKIIKRLEISLEATSQNYETRSLGYVFIINNRKFIAQEAQRHGWEPIIGNDWLKGNQKEIEENIQHYLSDSWGEITNILNLDIIKESDSIDFVAKLMEDKLRSFDQQFKNICRDHSTSYVLDDMLREHIIKSIEGKLLSPYLKFIESLKVLRKLARCTNNIKIPEVEGALKKLFFRRTHAVDAG